MEEIISHREALKISAKRMKEMLKEIRTKSESIPAGTNFDLLELVDSMDWSSIEKLVFAHYLGMIEYKAVLDTMSLFLLKDMM